MFFHFRTQTWCIFQTMRLQGKNIIWPNIILNMRLLIIKSNFFNSYSNFYDSRGVGGSMSNEEMGSDIGAGVNGEKLGTG